MIFNSRNKKPNSKKEVIRYLKRKKYTIPHLNDNDTHEIANDDEISMSVRKVQRQTYAIISEVTGDVRVKSFVML